MDTAVIGLGLIGGSVLRALAGAGHRVIGHDADAPTRAEAAAAGFAIAGSIAEAAAEAELIVLAVPLPVVPQVFARLAGHPGLITDVTSVKGPVRDLARQYGLRRFVGGHPMAGKETSSFAAAEADLFTGCAWVLCLDPPEAAGAAGPGKAAASGAEGDGASRLGEAAAAGTAREADGTSAAAMSDWLTLAAIWTGLGARVVPLSAAEHDRAVARVSHVPHLFAAVLAGQLHDPAAAALAAGSFRDGTRVAATRAELIAAMCGGNAAAVGAELDVLLAELHRLRALLDEDDPVGALVPALRPAGELRRGWPARPGAVTDLPAEAGALLALGRAGGWVTGVAKDRATVSAIRPETGRNAS